MEVKEILKNLRERNNLTQDQMAERINVTRQAVSRWETGLTQPNPEMLKVLSREFGVSINTLFLSIQEPEHPYWYGMSRCIFQIIFHKVT